MKVAKRCSEWASENPRSCIGLVAGATDVVALRRVRELCPQSWILCPGVGAQGGEADVSMITLITHSVVAYMLYVHVV